nr:linear gramicidin synthase subunit D [uncultured bacterium]
MEFRWDYSTDLFEAATIERMLAQWQTLLEGITADPDERISRLPVLPPAQRQQLLTQWNATRADYACDLCLHELFERQVERTPEAVALEFEEQSLTYRQLNARANQLAHYLRRQGVGPETLVGLCIERSIELVAALLGILKAGGAYLPLDPAYPPERLAFMLSDSGTRLLLTQSALEAALPRHAAQVLCLDPQQPSVAAESEANPKSPVAPQNLAYVIYTSGSTGRPKGTQLPHRGLCNVVAAQQRALGIERGSRVLQFASLSFDASVFEVVMALGSGSTLCLGTSAQLLPGPELVRFLKEKAVTTVTLPPSALTATAVEALPALKTITVAGEACPAELVARWGKGRRFFNLYGPTETTIWASSSECRVGGGKPLIGRPIANTQLYLLDRNYEPVPVGVVGELYIGGVGVARGYLKQPALTAEKFVPDPFGEEEGGRLYRSGDLARYQADGQIEFLGRVDQQVKVRGFRIELGEVESALRELAGVQEAVVVAREEPLGEKRLVAYLVPSNGAMNTSELRAHLKETLPEYMVPSAFVMLQALPLSPNGKVDRKALPAPEGMRAELGSVYEAPRNETEEALAAIWSQLLRIERVGIHDNFFDLGGHSLLVTQLISRVRDRFGVEIPVHGVFDARTLESMAAYLSRAQQGVPEEDDDLESILADLESLTEIEVKHRLGATL